MEGKSLLNKLLDSRPGLNKETELMHKKLLETAKECETMLNGVAANIIGDASADPLTKLSTLLDEGDVQAKKTLVGYNRTVFSELDDVAAKVADALSKGDRLVAAQLAGLLLMDHGVVNQQLRALLIYVNVLDAAYAESSGDPRLKLLRENMRTPSKAMKEADALEEEAVEAYNTGNQGEVYQAMALKQILRNMR